MSLFKVVLGNESKDCPTKKFFDCDKNRGMIYLGCKVSSTVGQTFLDYFDKRKLSSFVNNADLTNIGRDFIR